MKQTTPAAMPACFERWCKRFDDIWRHQAQKREFRNYIGGLLGESERKNLSQMAENAVGVTYHRLHHFLTQAPWDALEVNERRLIVMNQCSQSRISRGFTLIVDDSGHRKSGNFTAGVGRQYIGEIGKTDNGIVVVTTHLYDGKKSLPFWALFGLDICLSPASQKRMVSRWSVGDTNLVYEGVGKVQAAIDMNKLEAKEVDIDNHKIHILLPPPHIVDTSIDIKNSHVIASYRKGFGPSVESKLQTEAQQEALQAIKAEACANNLLDIANNNAKQLVEKVLQTSGFEKIIVETQKPQSGACLSN